MTRAKASALVLANWKGVFFERYLLDNHVTALEGANGAGKTTVMIAAYVVLLPDLSRLRFTNVGETGATGGDRGIWGRLGELGRPSYAALQVELASGDRLIAGVMLERRSEPSVDITTFLISDLGRDVRLSEVFLQSAAEHDEIPTLEGLRENVHRAGAKFRIFKSVKEYFTTLFDLGFSPMRLVSDEDRNKLNEMLRTSMTGGISRALTSELRSFVLKQESGLGDALGRMRGNLDTCRRTRTEVADARQLERELTGIYHAAIAMVRAAQAATRCEFEESETSVAVARHALDTAQARLKAQETTASQAETRQQTIAQRMQAARSNVERAGLAKARVVRTRETAARLREQLREFNVAQSHAVKLRSQQTKATAARTAAKLDRERAQEAFGRTAEGLANLQTGLDELHRQAHAHRLVQRKLAEAREALGEPALDEHNLAEAKQRVRDQSEAIDIERARRDREAQNAVQRRSDYDRALGALRALNPQALASASDPDALHACARAALGRLNDWEALSQRSRQLASEKLRHDALAERQANLREQAAFLEIAFKDSLSAGSIREALQSDDQRLVDLDEQQRDATWRAHEAKRSQQIARVRLAELTQRALRWSSIETAEQRLERQLPTLERNPAFLATLVDSLEQALDELRASRTRLETEREQIVDKVRTFESGAGTLSPELLLLADSVDAEPLATRFEDLDLDEARSMEARLGPLVDALVVDDPLSSAEQLLGQPRKESSIWLVAADAELPGERQTQLTATAEDLIIETPQGFRLTRAPELPRLGKNARDRRVTELRARAEELAAAAEQSSRSLRETETNLRASRTLLDAASLWLEGDPRPMLEQQQEHLLEQDRVEREQTQLAHEYRETATTLRARVSTLRTLTREAEALADTDHQARASELATLIEEATRAQEQLSAAAGPRKVLGELVDCLRYPPPDLATVAQWEDERSKLEVERDHWFQLGDALAAVESNRQAFLWADAERILTERTELVPELRAQHDRARELLEAAETVVESVEGGWESATAECQKAEAEAAAVEAHVERTRLELESEGARDFSDEALVQANVELARHEQALAILHEEERGLATDVAIASERTTQASAAVEECGKHLDVVEQEAKPARTSWKAFQKALESSAGSALTAEAHHPSDRLSSLFDGIEGAGEKPARKSIDYWPEAHTKRELLVDRLQSARGGQDLATKLRDNFDGESGNEPRRDGTLYLEAWLSVRDFLRRRLPAQVADVSDPLEALQRLQEDLEQLERRLIRQESDLGGASEDVARGIEVQIRRASSQIRRLNQFLDGISFGSIRAIRTRMKRVEKMEQVLRALREGAVQELLFQPTMPIEDALDEIFKRYGAGRTGGQRLLDYREYIELGVEIQRQTSTDWELANPTRLSTGEAIGVGAALMMVILTEWERDANLLRAKQRRNSLRFLFLDEANRLSQDNLAVLFELCKNLDLQLLIAAPEVAHAEGNTTYRLVRRLTEAGTEEVLVSGRRTSLPEDLPPPHRARRSLATESPPTQAPFTQPPAAESPPTQAPFTPPPATEPPPTQAWPAESPASPSPLAELSPAEPPLALPPAEEPPAAQVPGTEPPPESQDEPNQRQLFD